MKATVLAAATMALSMVQASELDIEVRRNGETPAVIGKANQFTGHVVITPLLPANGVTNANLGLVDFAPGARTAWHTHPMGQLLIVTAGRGWVQKEGQERQEIKPQDVVWIPAGVKHWHGATDSSPMTHLAMTYMLDGKNVNWQEIVSDEQYQ